MECERKLNWMRVFRVLVVSECFSHPILPPWLLLFLFRSLFFVFRFLESGSTPDPPWGRISSWRGLSKRTGLVLQQTKPLGPVQHSSRFSALPFLLAKLLVSLCECCTPPSKRINFWPLVAAAVSSFLPSYLPPHFLDCLETFNRRTREGGRRSTAGK